MMHCLDERLMVDKVIDGDAHAFAGLYREHVGKIRAIISWRLRDKEDIEDLVQITFYRAFKGLKTFRGRAAFSTWLTRIAINECMSYLRKRSVRADYWTCESVVADILSYSGPAPKIDPETRLCHKEEKARVRQGIWALPGVYREVVWLHYMEHMPLRDLATHFGVVEGTIKTWLYRGRRKLESILQKDFVS